MKSFNASPGRRVFIKVSPIRKPRKPAARSRQMVSGCEIPLSETSSGRLGLSEESRALARYLPEFFGYMERVFHIGDKCAEITVVDAYHIHIRVYISEFGKSVDFE